MQYPIRYYPMTIAGTNYYPASWQWTRELGLTPSSRQDGVSIPHTAVSLTLTQVDLGLRTTSTPEGQPVHHTQPRSLGSAFSEQASEGELTGPSIGYCAECGRTHHEVTERKGARVNKRLPSVIRGVHNSLRYTMPFGKSVECATERWCSFWFS